MTARVKNRLPSAQYPPAFGLEPAGPRRSGECALRKLCGLVLGSEQLRERLPDDLLGAIANESRRTGIPARNPSVEVDQVDRVVDDGVEQQLQLPGLVAGG
jgi:hypothetical protein